MLSNLVQGCGCDSVVQLLSLIPSTTRNEKKKILVQPYLEKVYNINQNKLCFTVD